MKANLVKSVANIKDLVSYDQSPIIVVKRKNEIAMLSSSQPATVETCPTPNEGEIISSLIGINHEDFSKRSDTLLIRLFI